MRIIKEGKLPPKEKEMTCPECGCVFMYDRSDIHSDQIVGVLQLIRTANIANKSIIHSF